MSPFGDFIDENIWVKHRGFNLLLYARQFQNKDNWFPAFGCRLDDFRILQHLSLSIAGHFWQQPKNFDFHTHDHFSGGAIDADVRYFFMTKPNSWIDAVSIDAGLIYKSKGFLPEELYLEKHFGFRIGTSIIL